MLPDAVSERILRLGYFEPEVSSFFIRHLRPGMTVLDVGAHVGYFSLLAAECVGLAGQVHAFEPTPLTAWLLRSNVEGCPHIQVVEGAVWKDGDGIELLDLGGALSSRNSVHGARLLALDRSVARRAPLRVRSLTLDCYCTERNLRPDLVKIHAEGAEHEILAGMGKLIDEVRPALVVEIEDLGAPDVVPGRELVEHILARGYTAFEPLMGTLRPHEPRAHYSITDLVFLP